MSLVDSVYSILFRQFLSKGELVKGRQELFDDPFFQKDNIIELLNQVSFKIHPLDMMFKLGAADHYLKVGLSAVTCIDKVLEVADSSKVKNILDFPCGYGRVLRFLVKRFPDASFTASDIDSRAIKFCFKLFGSSPEISQLDLNSFSLSEKFDLIWCGSLQTHLDEDATSNMMNFLRRHLNPKGICIFTTHGEYSYERMTNEKNCYGLKYEETKVVLEDYLDKGFGYSDHAVFGKDYGISLSSPAWIRKKAEEINGWKEVLFEKRGWDEHHDIYAYQVI